MTVRDAFEATLIELNKIQAPTIKVFEFNYYLNKAILLVVNKIYNIYDINQLTTDDLNALVKFYETDDLKGAISFDLPKDYLHLLNCNCIFKVLKSRKCWKVGESITIPATRATADSWGPIILDVYNRPSVKKPYYRIISKLVPDESPTYNIGSLQKIPINQCTIRYGNNNIATLEKVLIEYLRCPKQMILTQDQVDLIEDTSMPMEFPDYINQEIINELVHLLMEHDNNPRLGNNLLITLSIARPTGQLQQNK